MRKIAALALLGFALMPAPVWSQANLRPDPNPRVPPQPGQSLPYEDALFLKEAALAGRGQAELGRIVAERATDDALRALGQRIADTQRTLGSEIERLASSRNLPPASTLKQEEADRFGAAGTVTNPANAREDLSAKAVQSLSEASGEAFGKTYVEAQLRLHDRLVDLYQTEASNSPDRELSTFAITSLVAIQKDRDSLYQMAGRFGLETHREGQAIQYGDPAKAR
ncbi:DUF4142 domain-containing protein [Azospirillum sp. Sh1]|uniref:DUF4142 domain-containing protein n=1 Tax=Azospirillum sp. Sh1 TaxID=2607285 RepID=UPI0011EE3FE8|nr:DUF4142 domain-containing protein [Azospirillum sp. Sh1]KAA0572903.1 DUF4142 domain-containing protein [Azospirillum sp. Sh1]